MLWNHTERIKFDIIDKMAVPPWESDNPLIGRVMVFNTAEGQFIVARTQMSRFFYPNESIFQKAVARFRHETRDFAEANGLHLLESDQ